MKTSYNVHLTTSTLPMPSWWEIVGVIKFVKLFVYVLLSYSNMFRIEVSAESGGFCKKVVGCSRDFFKFEGANL